MSFISFTVLLVDRLSSFSISSLSFLLLHAGSSTSDSHVLNDCAVWTEINPLCERRSTACCISAVASSLGVTSLVLGSNKQWSFSTSVSGCENPAYEGSSFWRTCTDAAAIFRVLLCRFFDTMFVSFKRSVIIVRVMQNSKSFAFIGDVASPAVLRS